MAGRDPAVRDRLRALRTQRWLPALEQQLRQAYPHADEGTVADVGYGLVCLSEAHWAFQLQGVDEPGRRDSARVVAQAILATLAP